MVETHVVANRKPRLPSGDHRAQLNVPIAIRGLLSPLGNGFGGRGRWLGCGLNLFRSEFQVAVVNRVCEGLGQSLAQT
jgi:hypothetical protein